MSKAAENLRDLLSLAQMLRRFAMEQTQDNHHVLFISTAMALEARAQTMATALKAEPVIDKRRERALHAPVNCLV